MPRKLSHTRICETDLPVSMDAPQGANKLSQGSLLVDSQPHRSPLRSSPRKLSIRRAGTHSGDEE